MTIEVMKQALEALELYQSKSSVQMFDVAAKGLRAAIEQAEQPVAWMWADGTITTDPDRADGTWTPLYTAPRQWQWLTHKEIDAKMDFRATVRYFEAKLKEKNG